MRQGLSRPFWLALVIAAFCLPLFIGLDRTDIENDEAIYSFAVDQMVATGDWLNPRSSPDADVVFLEKPPLKFWIVALPIRLGLLPHNEIGLRFWDVLFGAVAFLYVFAIGRRLAGVVCGLIAVMLLFVYQPLLFEHGLRGNNMEAPLFLCYCGGIYHFIAWGAGAEIERRRRHIVAVALYFFLGFMTKFVAALFLPVVLAATVVVLPPVRSRLVADFGYWIAAAGLVVALAVPWFIYQQVASGSAVWSVMFGTHVLMRFTSSVDPAHVQPWNFYGLAIWKELSHLGRAWLAPVGLVLLGLAAWRQRRIEEVTVIAWLTLPLALMSLGTSKLHHYAYPFLPAVALAIGFGPGWLAQTSAPYLARVTNNIDTRVAAAGGWRAVAGRVLLVLSAGATLLAVATFLLGAVVLRVGQVEIIRNSHVVRPLLVAFVLATLAGRSVQAARLLVPLALLLLVPRDPYADVLRRMKVEAHPLRSTRDCLISVRETALPAGSPAPGVYAIGERKWFLHSYFYYLHRAGGWQRTDTVDARILDEALFVPGRERPVLIGDEDYRAVKAGHEAAVQSIAVLGLRDVLLLMPGPYARCEPQAHRKRES